MTNLADQEQNAAQRGGLRATRGSPEGKPRPEKARKEPPLRKPVAKAAAPKAEPGSKQRVVPVHVVNHVPGHLDAPQRSAMLTYDAGQPFWMKLPAVAGFFVKLALWPFHALRIAIDTALAVLLLVILVPLVAWSMGYVPDAIAIPFFETLGERGLSLVRALGLEI